MEVEPLLEGPLGNPRRRLATCFGAICFALGCGEPALPAREASAARNLVLISVDTLRADHLGCYGGDPSLSPAIDALAAESVRFERAYSPAPFTLPAVGALLTGHYPGTIGLRSNLSRLPPGMSSLAARLAAAGHATAAVVSNPVLAPRSRLDAGFAEYDAWIPEPAAAASRRDRDARATTDRALAFLERLEEGATPFFLWVHYQDPHGPYTPPDALRARYLEAARALPGGLRRLPALEGLRGQGGIPAYQYQPPHHEAAWYRAGYAAEVRNMDAELGRLLERLRSPQRVADTVVVFTADHGEALGERDYWFAHGEFLDEPAVHVPLILRAPGLGPGVRETTASLVDVVPTVLALLGVPAAGGEGIDLLSAASDAERAVHTRTTEAAASRAREAVVAGGFKLVVEHNETGASERLYRLPDESIDTAAAHPEVLLALRARLAAGSVRAAAPVAPDPPPTEAEIERLRALGYVVESAP